MDKNSSLYFYDEINKLKFDIFVFNDLKKHDNNKEKEEEKSDHVCKITGLVLQDDHVTLECNHSFNYHSIYNELLTQKKVNPCFEIQCPYCRNIQHKLLPEHKYYKPIYGINTFEKNEIKKKNKKKYFHPEKKKIENN